MSDYWAGGTHATAGSINMLYSRVVISNVISMWTGDIEEVTCSAHHHPASADQIQGLKRLSTPDLPVTTSALSLCVGSRLLWSTNACAATAYSAVAVLTDAVYR